MSEYAAGHGRPEFVADGKLVARRPLNHGDRTRQPGEEVPRLDLTARQVAMLWSQGWIDTLPASPAPQQGKSGQHTQRAK